MHLRSEIAVTHGEYPVPGEFGVSVYRIRDCDTAVGPSREPCPAVRRIWYVRSGEDSAGDDRRRPVYGPVENETDCVFRKILRRIHCIDGHVPRYGGGEIHQCRILCRRVQGPAPERVLLPVLHIFRDRHGVFRGGVPFGDRLPVGPAVPVVDHRILLGLSEDGRESAVLRHGRRHVAPSPQDIPFRRDVCRHLIGCDGFPVLHLGRTHSLPFRLEGDVEITLHDRDALIGIGHRPSRVEFAVVRLDVDACQIPVYPGIVVSQSILVVRPLITDIHVLGPICPIVAPPEILITHTEHGGDPILKVVAVAVRARMGGQVEIVGCHGALEDLSEIGPASFQPETRFTYLRGECGLNLGRIGIVTVDESHKYVSIRDRLEIRNGIHNLPFDMRYGRHVETVSRTADQLAVRVTVETHRRPIVGTQRHPLMDDPGVFSSRRHTVHGFDLTQIRKDQTYTEFLRRRGHRLFHRRCGDSRRLSFAAGVLEVDTEILPRGRFGIVHAVQNYGGRQCQQCKNSCNGDLIPIHLSAPSIGRFGRTYISPSRSKPTTDSTSYTFPMRSSVTISLGSPMFTMVPFFMIMQ